MKKRFIIIIFFIILCGLLFAGTKSIRFYVFYSDDCELCHDFFENYLPEIEPYYNIEYKKFEIGNEKNLVLLDKLEEKYKKTADIPEIFIGKYLIGGREIKEKFEDILQEYSQEGCNYPVLENITEADTVATSDNKIYVAYFYKVGCKHCDKTYYDLQILKKKYPRLFVKEFNIKDKTSMELNEALCEKYKVPIKKRLSTPMVFIGEKYLLGKNARKSEIERLIKKNHTEIAPWDRVKVEQDNLFKIIKNRFKSFGILTVAFAGLIDGINPCAFATIIFLISYLTLLKRKGKEIIVIGSAYTISVFLTYLFVGILGLNILEFMRNYRLVSLFVKVIFLGTGILVIIFSALSFYDYWLIKKGKSSDMILQLPSKIKKKIHKNIREKSKIGNLIVGSFLIGFLVSIQELFCTGQVYLPTLVYMTNFQNYKTEAFLYLLLYNILFILPLLVVFFAFYKGVSSDVMQRFMKNNLSFSKILLGIIFLALGVVLLVSGFTG